MLRYTDETSEVGQIKAGVLHRKLSSKHQGLINRLSRWKDYLRLSPVGDAISKAIRDTNILHSKYVIHIERVRTAEERLSSFELKL